MKIALYCRHGGLTKLLTDLWEDHEVSVTGEFDDPLYKTADITVSTIFFQDLEHIRTERPVFAYNTNPLSALSYHGLGYWLNKSNFAIINSIPDYVEEDYMRRYLPADYVIRYALKNYPKWERKNDKILVINRKPDARLGNVTQAKWGKAHTVAEIIGGIDYEIVNTPSHEDLKRKMAECAGVFYFSNNPMTIVMHEIMEIGVPCVALKSCFYQNTKYIERCFGEYAVDTLDEIRSLLKTIVENKDLEKPNYTYNTSFQEIKKQWNDLFKRYYDMYGSRSLVL